MTDKITIKAPEGNEFGLSVSRTSTTTGGDFETRQLKAGEESDFEFGNDQQIVIQRGAAEERDAPKKEDEKTKKE